MAAAEEPIALKPRITFGKFANVDLRVVEVIEAPLAEGLAKPCRVLTLDAGPLGTFTSVGQFALIPEEELVGSKLIACCNLSPREMGPYVSEVLVLGAIHPDNPPGEQQATPLRVDNGVAAGEAIF